MKKLTSRQKAILDYISEQVRTKNYPPSVREICKEMELSSSSTVHSHLRALERKGYIKRDPTKPRAIEILHPATRSGSRKKSRLVPLVGQVTAGSPILAEENIEDYIVLPEEMSGNGDTVFMLRVRGESMKGAGILEGDMVIVRQQPAAENGEIVVALLDNEATVKRFYREKEIIRLQPDNPDYEPILSKGEVQILGKVVGLMRNLE